VEVDEPRDLPTCRYYADGRVVLVHTMEEYWALQPGHADNPSGPFPVPPVLPEDVPDALVPDARREQARAMRLLGQSQQTIADTLGVARRTVRMWLKEEGDAV
jgi:hypothetical protein